MSAGPALIELASKLPSSPSHIRQRVGCNPGTTAKALCAPSRRNPQDSGSSALQTMLPSSEDTSQDGCVKTEPADSSNWRASASSTSESSLDGNKKPRKRRNLCICEQVSCNVPGGRCREVEVAAGEDHWLHGSMYQIPPKGVLRCGVDIRKQWLLHLGISEDSLDAKKILKPEIRWTHFPETYFKRDNQDNTTVTAAHLRPKRRRLCYTVEPSIDTLPGDMIHSGKHQNKAVPTPVTSVFLPKAGGLTSHLPAPATSMPAPGMLYSDPRFATNPYLAYASPLSMLAQANHGQGAGPAGPPNQLPNQGNGALLQYMAAAAAANPAAAPFYQALGYNQDSAVQALSAAGFAAQFAQAQRAHFTTSQELHGATGRGQETGASTGNGDRLGQHAQRNPQTDVGRCLSTTAQNGLAQSSALQHDLAASMHGWSRQHQPGPIDIDAFSSSAAARSAYGQPLVSEAAVYAAYPSALNPRGISQLANNNSAPRGASAAAHILRAEQTRPTFVRGLQDEVYRTKHELSRNETADLRVQRPESGHDGRDVTSHVRYLESELQHLRKSRDARISTLQAELHVLQGEPTAKRFRHT